MGVRISGRRHWLWRAVDEHGHPLDVPLQERRDTAAAERFSPRLRVAAHGVPPAQITTGKLGSSAAARAQLPALSGVDHSRVRSAMRCNNRVDQAHQRTGVCERVLRLFRSTAPGQRVLDAFSRVCNLIRPAAIPSRPRRKAGPRPRQGVGRRILP